MEHDLSDTGWAYWHLEHQYPGVWFCEQHGAPLHEATVKSTGVDRFLWSLPDRRNLTLDWLQDSADAETLKKLTAMTLQLLRASRSPGWLDGAHMVPVLREAIRRHGWLTPNGNLRVGELAPSYLAWCQILRGPMELGSLPDSESEAASQIGRLLRPWRSGTHPLRVLVAVSWLFDRAESFFGAYDSLHDPSVQSPALVPPGNVPTTLLSSKNNAVKAQLVAHARAGMGVRHPADTQSRTDIVMTTDFVVNVRTGDTITLAARSVKPASELDKARTLEKQEIERRYWHVKGVDWGLVTDLDSAGCRNCAEMRSKPFCAQPHR
ncbi:MAG: TnsA endonuclease N-terminal domain-containing protein [Rhodoferax sp.]|uniref:TnsA endonuclease N-terminal domain-containing protein n=1 Tax=Rhodoferax sp. TaxID=50421 RepID=UPI0027323E0D|nr:TnsA endonuclease N-terminal domain-containing protein [Rhodoferax sp.]MDP2680778.1 TnsA endonuclease N-terminal domain-containing protein [Rhodoferax sp.]